MKKTFMTLLMLIFASFMFCKEPAKDKEYFDEEKDLFLEIKGNFLDPNKISSLYLYHHKPYLHPYLGLQVFSGFSDIIVYDKCTEKTYDLHLNSGGITESYALNDLPLKEIGIPIIVDGLVYGYVADINENGLDEIYIHCVTNVYSPEFFEYNPKTKQFEKILDFERYSNSVVIEDFDIEKKQFTFMTYAVGSNRDVVEQVYTWNDESNKYEQTSTIVYPHAEFFK